MSEFEQILFFDELSIFSNWNKRDFKVYGQTFNSGKQALVWMKAIVFSDKEVVGKIFDIKNPVDQEYLGKTIKNFNQNIWDDLKYTFMEVIVAAKFESNEDYKQMLLDTYPKKMIYASRLDDIWGIGIDEKKARKIYEKEWHGDNLLGKVLTSYRDAYFDDIP